MRIVQVCPSSVEGTICPPPSKSAAHRALICTALAGTGSVHGIIDSEDMYATMGALQGIGIHFTHKDDRVQVYQQDQPHKSDPITVNCVESGSTLRFLIPIFAAKGISSVFVGQGRLPARPLGVYQDCLPPHGIRMTTGGGLPLRIEGKLEGGEYILPGNVSSQFISGLLFALPLCKNDSDLFLSSSLESSAYVDMTIDAMQQAGVCVSARNHGWHIPGGQRYLPQEYRVEGDWSQAAFLMAAGILAGKVRVTGMNSESFQGDRAIIEIFKGFGANVEWSGREILCRKSALHGQRIDAAQIPDLVPVLAVTAAFAEGTTQIFGAARLRLKESDRLRAITDCLQRIGGQIEEYADGLCIHGCKQLKGGATVSGYGDHRIVMSMAIAALKCQNPVNIEDAESVSKSWPTFFEDYQRIGGIVHVL